MEIIILNHTYILVTKLRPLLDLLNLFANVTFVIIFIHTEILDPLLYLFLYYYYSHKWFSLTY